MRHPRLLLIDMTPITGYAATSTLKAAYFQDWEAGRLLHLQSLGDGRLGLAANEGDGAPWLFEPSEDAAAALLAAFRPDVILYRPVSDDSVLHNFAMRVIKALSVPLAIWIMDDWPARLSVREPARFSELNADLKELFARSRLNIAISDGMAKAFGERYGSEFKVAHNGVLESDWPAPLRSAKKDKIIIRYSGAMAEDTSLASLLETAEVVSDLVNDGAPVRLEIRTQSTWYAQSSKKFKSFRGVSIKKAELSTDQYREWLCRADIALVCYNFSEETRRYLQYSFANKIPEILASGASILAYGPVSLETIKYLKANDLALMVEQQEPQTLREAVMRLVEDRTLRETLGDRARAHAISIFSFPTMRDHMTRALSDLASQESSEALVPMSRDSKTQFDECRFVFSALGAADYCGVMIDVGAHSGGALRPFAKAGWRVFAFEPDVNNCNALLRSYGGQPNVIISAMAVSDEAVSDVAFFRSDISTGISGLSAFHESHFEADKVDTTTLDTVITEEHLSAIDFLKIDVEGFEMRVLKGLDFQHLKPRSIVVEFEDRKTQTHGYAMSDLAELLSRHGYRVYVSEWHPIAEYGMKHSWKSLYPYPGKTSENAWGNLIALLEPLDEKTMTKARADALDAGLANSGAVVQMLAMPIGKPSFYKRIAVHLFENHPGVAKQMRPAVLLVKRMLGR